MQQQFRNRSMGLRLARQHVDCEIASQHGQIQSVDAPGHTQWITHLSIADDVPATRALRALFDVLVRAAQPFAVQSLHIAVARNGWLESYLADFGFAKFERLSMFQCDAPLPFGTGRLHIRRAAFSEESSLFALDQASFTSPYAIGPATIKRLLDTSMVFVAEEGAALLGYVAGDVHQRVLHIERVAVQADSRRRGIASALMRELAQASTARQMTLNSAESQRAAHALYRKLGFAERGSFASVWRRDLA